MLCKNSIYIEYQANEIFILNNYILSTNSNCLYCNIPIRKTKCSVFILFINMSNIFYIVICEVLWFLKKEKKRKRLINYIMNLESTFLSTLHFSSSLFSRLFAFIEWDHSFIHLVYRG